MITSTVSASPSSSSSPIYPQFPNHSKIFTNTRTLSIPVNIRNRPGAPTRIRSNNTTKAMYSSSAAAATEESLYELLGIAGAGSSFDDIKKAYRVMARKYHPDVAPADRVDEHTRRFIMVKQAYDTLSNPQKKALYDRDLCGGRRPSYDYDNMEEKVEWRHRWEAQLEELKKKGSSRRTNSWASRMKNARR